MVLQYVMMLEVESIECGAGMALGSLTAKVLHVPVLRERLHLQNGNLALLNR